MLLAVGAAGQQGEIILSSRPFTPGIHFSSRSNLVEVPVIVTNAQGRTISGLTSSDFLIKDDGKPQTVAAFAVETNAAAPSGAIPEPGATQDTAARRPPRSVLLLFDDLNTPPGALGFVRRGALDYLATNANSGDRFSVRTTSQSGDLDFTHDRAAAAAAIRAVMSRSGASSAARHRARRGLPTHLSDMNAEFQELYSARTLDGLETALRYAADQPGNRTIVMASSGFQVAFMEFGSLLTQRVNDLIELALRAGIQISSIDAAGVDPDAGLRHWSENAGVLNQLAEDTGGTLIENRNQFSDAWSRLADGPEISYRIGFSPMPWRADGKLHQIQVALTGHRSGHVAARHGYFAPLELATDADADASEAKFNQALNGGRMSELPAKLVLQSLTSAESDAAGTPHGVRPLVVLDAAALPLVKDHGMNRERLRFVAVLRDAAGKQVAGREGDMELNLDGASRKRFARDGLKAALPLISPPGIYKLTVVVQEAVHGATSTFGPVGVEIR